MKTLLITLMLALPTLSIAHVDVDVDGGGDGDKEEKFEVKTLTPEQIASLAKVDAQVQKAAENLKLATEAMQKAQSDAEVAKAEVLANDAPVSANCGNGLTTFSSYTSTTKQFYRTVEIKGKYILISSGIITCPPSVVLTNTTGWTAVPATHIPNIANIVVK